MSRRVYASVSGGVVNEVIVPPQTDGTWTVIDWDNIEADPAREWNQLDEEDRAYIRKNYPDDYAKYFSQLAATKVPIPKNPERNFRRKGGIDDE